MIIISLFFEFRSSDIITKIREQGDIPIDTERDKCPGNHCISLYLSVSVSVSVSISVSITVIIIHLCNVSPIYLCWVETSNEYIVHVYMYLLFDLKWDTGEMRLCDNDVFLYWIFENIIFVIWLYMIHCICIYFLFRELLYQKGICIKILNITLFYRTI